MSERELCDEQNEENKNPLRHLRGYLGSRPLAEHQRHSGMEAFDGRDPDEISKEYYDRGFEVYDFDAPIEDLKMIGPYRLLIRFGRAG